MDSVLKRSLSRWGKLVLRKCQLLVLPGFGVQSQFLQIGFHFKITTVFWRVVSGTPARSLWLMCISP